MVLVDNQRTGEAGFECFTISTNQLVRILGFERDLGTTGVVVAIGRNTVGIDAFSIG